MSSVKRAQKIMMVLATIPGVLSAVGIVAYFTSPHLDFRPLGLLAGWTCFSVVIVSQAQGAIKTLEQKIESLKSGSSEAPAAADSESTEPADE
ncbi:MAG: hypothetical protein QGH11_13910 [Pirellulaceae bacterium]|jgi:ABC-type spermidine/putrescine transport system permease subunit II|nr:hypothetical protein [Pirellulaceae bacterium]